MNDCIICTTSKRVRNFGGASASRSASQAYSRPAPRSYNAYRGRQGTGRGNIGRRG